MSRLFALLLVLLLSTADAAQPDPKEPPPGPFSGRDGKAKEKLLKEFGGTDASENAVALGLLWLGKQQKKDGSWEYDGSAKAELTAATGMAVLAYLGAGDTHKDKGKHQKTIQSGLNWLVKHCPATGANAGKFQSAATMYGQAIGTLALVEAYGMTKDKTLLLGPAQAAVNYIQKAQAANGSWGYRPGELGDTSIVGWQIQALHAAKLTKDIKVDDKVIKNAIKFLDFAGAGDNKSRYGYRDAVGATEGTALTAVGLLCRERIDGWDAKNVGLTEGVTGLLKRGPAPFRRKADRSILRPLRHAGPPRIRRRRVEELARGAEGGRRHAQGRATRLPDQPPDPEGRPEPRELEPDPGHIGQNCGRIGTTAMSAIVLEAPYRHLPMKLPDPKKP